MSNSCIVISGPSGSGKDVITEALLKRFPVLTRVVTTTSRPKRRDDRNGIDYNFLSREQFERMIAGGQLLEWVIFSGNYYGLPKDSVDAVHEARRIPILIIDVRGAATIKKLYPNALLVFLYPDPV
ncbi:MAG: guanylate kinase, partial [Candidatus Diapherotrites archaeon]|nr:guanylate kinase [Candidatus Diapherotrites archaeon]